MVLDPAIAVVLSAVVSALGGAAVLILGRRIDNRYGVPSDFESTMLQHRKDYEQLLTNEIESRKVAQASCEQRLEQAELREAAMLRRLDDAESTILRLRMRLGELG